MEMDFKETEERKTQVVFIKEILKRKSKVLHGALKNLSLFSD